MKDSDKVINLIKNAGTKMRPRRYFVARAMFVILGAVLLFCLILFFVTFIIFALQENGGLFATNFGPVEWGVFLESLPWSLLLLSLALILIMWILLRRYAIVYHQPFLYTLLILVIVISLACFFLSASSIHGGIFRYASRNQFPMVEGVYEFETTPMNGMYRGQVTLLATSSFIIKNPFGQTSTVFLIPAASSELGQIDPGDYVIVFGRNVATATIDAAGVETIEDYQ